MKKLFTKSVCVLLVLLLAIGLCPVSMSAVAADMFDRNDSVCANVGTADAGSALADGIASDVRVPAADDNAVSAQVATGTLTVSPRSVQFIARESAEITCAYTGFDGIKIRIIARVNSNTSPLKGDFGEWNGNSIKLKISCNTTCKETVYIRLISPDDASTIYAEQTVSVEVIHGIYTVTPEKLEMKIGDTGKVKCYVRGFYDHALVNVYAHSEDDVSFVTGTWDNWAENTKVMTIEANAAGTADVLFDLYDANTNEIIASQTVKITVKKSFFTILWEIISFPFRVILYPFALLWSIFA